MLKKKLVLYIYFSQMFFLTSPNTLTLSIIFLGLGLSIIIRLLFKLVDSEDYADYAEMDDWFEIGGSE